MTEKSQITLAAFVSEGEREAANVAARHIARALGNATGIPWACDCEFRPGLETLWKAGDTTILVASLLPGLEKIEVPWSQEEERLRKAFAKMGETGLPVFVCTILRHIAHDVEAKKAAALRLRIRQLNLLATELSREMGIFVIDFDRILADAGALHFQTDYRLRGSVAAEMAGHFMALTLVTNGVDAVLPFETLDAVREVLLAAKPAVPGAERVPGEMTLKKNVLSLGQGRRKQKVATVAYTVEDNYAGWLVRQVLRGSIGPAEAMQRLLHAVRRRGVKESAVMLASGLSRQIKGRK